MIRIGVLGGSFDPVHRGHLELAKDAADQAGLNEVILSPTRIQPFKQGIQVTSGDDRLNMLSLAAEADERIRVSRYELDKEGVSYTYLTLRHFRKLYEDTNSKDGNEEVKLYFISGTDSFLKIETWMEAGEILRNYSHIVGSRPGYMEQELRQCIDRVHKNYGTEVLKIENKQLDISSTLIRERLAEGLPVDDLISDKVERYIRGHGLYGLS